jgi:hypothetical protein
MRAQSPMHSSRADHYWEVSFSDLTREIYEYNAVIRPACFDSAEPMFEPTISSAAAYLDQLTVPSVFSKCLNLLIDYVLKRPASAVRSRLWPPHTLPMKFYMTQKPAD